LSQECYSKMEVVITDKIEAADEELIFQGLLEYNLAKLEDKKREDLGIYIDEAGERIGGLIGNTHGNWLSVKYLWIKQEFRRQNIGSRILQQAEEIAKIRGCKFVFLDTFAFQAPDFYKKHGYKEVFVLEEYPISGKRYYFTKVI